MNAAGFVLLVFLSNGHIWQVAAPETFKECQIQASRLWHHYGHRGYCEEAGRQVLARRGTVSQMMQDDWDH